LAFASLGQVRIQKGDLIGAHQWLEQGIVHAGNESTPQFWMGILYSVSGDQKKALDQLFQALETDPAAPNVHRWIASVANYLEDFELMKKHAQLAIDYGQPDIVYDLINAHIGLGDLDTARALIANISPELLEHSFVASELNEYEFYTAYLAEPQDVETLRRLAREFVQDYIGIRNWEPIDGLDLTETLAERIRSEGINPTANPILFFTSPESRAFRERPEFRMVVDQLQLVKFWKLYGWPDVCRPKGNDDFECD
jgi:tetratricopeptide (TPR) repeat protein